MEQCLLVKSIVPRLLAACRPAMPLTTCMRSSSSFDPDMISAP